MAHPQHVLIAPLDWGMGHATRCIPLIKAYQQKGYSVLLAAPQHLLDSMRPRLSNIEFLTIPGYEITYHKHLPVWLSVVLQLPKIRKAIQTEHQWLLEQSARLNLSLIISDNRYGLWHPEIKSVMLTHQLQPIAPFGGRLAASIIRRIMRHLFTHFDEIYVPDLEGPQRISGKLSEPFEGLPPVRYIGLLSRFTKPSTIDVVPNTMLAMLSGPEPHYSAFYYRMRQYAFNKGIAFKALGWKMPKNAQGNDILLNANDKQFSAEVAKAATLVCAAGYSTLCDLAVLKREAQLFPTPGQTEQEYLAKRMKALYQPLTQ